MRNGIIIICIAYSLGGAQYSLAGEFTLDKWVLTTMVQGPGAVESDFRFSFDPVTPYSAIHQATVGNSTSLSNYTAWWNPSGLFEFLINAEHKAVGGNSVSSRSVSSVNLSPTVDSILTIDAEYDYALGNGDREGNFDVGVWEDGVGLIYFEQEFVLPIGGDPRIGSWSANHIMPLEAGVNYQIGYTLALWSFGGSPTNLSTGNGSVHFSIVPVPEPTTCCILLVAAARFARRRLRQHAAIGE